MSPEETVRAYLDARSCRSVPAQLIKTSYGRITRSSVTIAVTRSAGVTSKA
jgi:hypothetical protein